MSRFFWKQERQLSRVLVGFQHCQYLTFCSLQFCIFMWCLLVHYSVSSCSSIVKNVRTYPRRRNICAWIGNASWSLFNSITIPFHPGVCQNQVDSVTRDSPNAFPRGPRSEIRFGTKFTSARERGPRSESATSHGFPISELGILLKVKRGTLGPR